MDGTDENFIHNFRKKTCWEGYRLEDLDVDGGGQC